MVTSAPGTLAVLKNELTRSSRNEPSLVVGNPGERERERNQHVNILYVNTLYLNMYMYCMYSFVCMYIL